MIRLTRQTDYGIVLLTHVARSPADQPHSARDLAADTGLPLPMVGKILKTLARDGLLISQRGVKGGYRLARMAEEISVAEIIGSLEGPIALTECTIDGPASCEQEALCPTRGHWHKINEAIRTALEGISLAEMALPLAEVVAESGTRSPIQVRLA